MSGSISCGNWYQHSKASIQKEKLDLHESYCLRFNVYCDTCKEAYDKRDDPQHAKSHQTAACSICGEAVENRRKEDHLKLCKEKFECPFCSLTISKHSIERHKKECGSRTDTCELCRLPVKKSELELHWETCLGYDARPPENSSELKRNPIFDSGQRGRTSDESEISMAKSKSNFEQYLKKKKKETVAPKASKQPKDSKQSNAGNNSSKGNYKSELSALNRSFEQSNFHPANSQEDNELEQAIMQSLMDY